MSEIVNDRNGKEAGPPRSVPDREQDKSGDMLYTIEDVPPWYMCIILGIQVNHSAVPALVNYILMQ